MMGKCMCEGGMKKCMTHCKWCPLMPMILGLVLFLLGYFLDATVVRILWLIVSGSIIVMGITCFVMMPFMKKIGRS